MGTAHRKDLSKWNSVRDNNFLRLYSRNDAIKSYTTFYDDLSFACRAFEDVNFRFFVEPPADGSLPVDHLQFNPTVMAKMHDVGVEQAKKAIRGEMCTRV